MRQIRNKIIKVVFIIAIILLNNVFVLINTSNANERMVNLYSKEEVKGLLIYKGIRVATQIVVYQEDGKEYPAYCLNRDIEGITLDRTYAVKANDEVTNEQIWRAITNGYPYKTPSELGCASYQEAFVATKMAVYDILYNYDYNDFEPVGDAGSRVFQAMKNISSKARSLNNVRQHINLEFNAENENWEIEKEYIIKKYNVLTQASNYSVSLAGQNLNGIEILDENNRQKSTFSKGEKFKIRIPIKELVEDKTFEINVNAKMQTNPILHGVPLGNLQDYALTKNGYEEVHKKTEETCRKNETEIKVIKKDGETNIGLEGVKFNLLDENKKVILKDLITDKEGKISINGIIYGKYYLEEQETLEEYKKYNELIEIDVAHNEVKTVEVDNFKKPKEDKIIEAKSEEKIEIKLPRTGF